MCKVNELEAADDNSALYCFTCGGEYGATRGDYFWASGNDTCRTDRISSSYPMVLATARAFTHMARRA